MIRSSLLVSLLALLALLAAPAPIRAQEVQKDEMSAAERATHLASFDHVWTTIRDIHWSPDLGGLDWDAVRGELRPRVEAARTADEVRATLNDLLGRLGESHYAIFPGDLIADDVAADDALADDTAADDTGVKDTAADEPEISPAAESPDQEPETEDDDEGSGGESGIVFTVVGDRVLVREVRAESPAARVGVQAGWELVRVGKREVRVLFERVAARHGDHHGELYLLGMVHARLDRAPGRRVRLVFREEPEGSTVEKVVKLAAPEGTSFRFGNLPPFRVTFASRRLADGSAYIAFNAFMAPLLVMKKFADAVEEFRGAPGLVIDLRGNPGGLGVMAQGMAGYLLSERDQSLGMMKMRATTLNFIVNPRSPAYDGPVAVLIDGTSASTSEIFAGGLQELGRARVFGSTSAGAALPSVVEKLPNGDGFQYAIADFTTPKGARLEGRGVVPDVGIEHDQESLRLGRDLVLESAIDWLRSTDNTRGE